MRAACVFLALLTLEACAGLHDARRADPMVESTVASSGPLPSVLGIGRAATSGEIDRVDIDVMPDGTGLPAGWGTVDGGAAIFALKCAPCHGAEGEGTAAALALVGRRPGDRFDFAEASPAPDKTIGNYWPYATTVFDYVRRAMPYDRPGSLAAEEVYALTAWLLWKNGLIESTSVMDAQTLPAVLMPARDRFVRDDREASPRVR